MSSIKIRAPLIEGRDTAAATMDDGVVVMRAAEMISRNESGTVPSLT